MSIDSVGELMGMDRGTRGDGEYRAAIMAEQDALTASRGTVTAIETAVHRLPGVQRVLLVDQQPIGTFTIVSLGGDRAAVQSVIDDQKACGIECRLVVWPHETFPPAPAPWYRRTWSWLRFRWPIWMASTIMFVPGALAIVSGDVVPGVVILALALGVTLWAATRVSE